ncbi:GAF and ANTAR domain-containing protein [Auraticoccus monumenti]|uniref:GAF domain-containing protein n=1 Tax=Auraticoccus monumenti TaxID=675864 RepID=A0A1G7BU44_9ACTN|nr:GAF and ANTAR domain-containing protein [Auraticoccus monumenti]SDE30517.1 GAF domain-containing protein [Auraticoccus monumenti]
MQVQELAEVLESVARRTSARTSMEEALGLLAQTAQETIPGADHVSVSVTRRGGRIETVAASGDLVRQLDAVQYELMEGPCVDSIRGRERRIANDLGHDDRWPAFGPRAVQLGVRSQMGLDLFDEDDSIGGLNLYGEEAGAFTDASVQVAVLFGAQASQLLGRRMRESQLTEAVQTRQLIGQATGIVMERYQLSAERAFEFLARVSQQGNIKLVAVAAELVEQAGRPASQ